MSSLITSVSSNSLNIVSNYDLSEPVRQDSISNTRSSTPIPTAANEPTPSNKRVIKSFFKFIKTSRKNKKKLSSSINNLSQTGSVEEKIKKNSKLRTSKSIAFLNALNNDSSLSSDESEFSKSQGKNSIKKKNEKKTKNRFKKDRSLSLSFKPTVASPTPSSFSLSSGCLSKTCKFSASSKELNWYRLEELDSYYRVLGKLDISRIYVQPFLIENFKIHFIKTMIKKI